MITQVEVRSFPRVHVTLVDLAGVTRRRYGGAGFALDLFPVEVVARVASSNALTWDVPVAARDATDAEAVLERLSAALRKKFAIGVRRLPPQHVGFGSKTAFLLAVSAACNSLLGSPLTHSDLKKLSGRGSASGIGINTFFSGGLVIDLGHPSSPEEPFTPSSSRPPISTPPAAVQLAFPEEWQVHLFMPDGRKYESCEEVTFFACNTPIPTEEAWRVLAAVYHGLLPAFVNRDLQLLRASLKDIHATGFKRRELEGQGACVAHVIELLAEYEDVAAGLSSMGPLVYAIAPTGQAPAMATLGERLQHMGLATYLGAAAGRNTGHETGRPSDD